MTSIEKRELTLLLLRTPQCASLAHASLFRHPVQNRNRTKPYIHVPVGASTMATMVRDVIYAFLKSARKCHDAQKCLSKDNQIFYLFLVIYSCRCGFIELNGVWTPHIKGKRVTRYWYPRYALLTIKQ